MTPLQETQTPLVSGMLCVLPPNLAFVIRISRLRYRVTAWAAIGVGEAAAVEQDRDRVHGGRRDEWDTSRGAVAVGWYGLSIPPVDGGDIVLGGAEVFGADAKRSTGDFQAQFVIVDF